MSRDPEAFIRRRSPVWRELGELLARDAPLSTLAPASLSRAAALYRAVCADLMRARALRCSREVVDYLDALTARAHNALYSEASRSSKARALLELAEFPRAFRRNARFMWASALLFLAPLAIGWIGARFSPTFAERVLPPGVLENMADAYSRGFGGGRASETNAAMSGFYVYNNVGIAFRCFATGILFGLGSAFFLIYNGLTIGTVVGFVSGGGYGHNILTFICGHGPYELTAIVIAGGAGLCMGHALIETGGRTRIGSLRGRAPDLIALVLGAAGMLLIAAAVEAFWSPSSLPGPVKYGFSAVSTLLVFGFLFFYGRRPAPLGGARP